MMVDTAIFSKRLDALEDYLQRLRSLGQASRAAYVADRKIHGIAYRAIREDLGDLDAFRRWALGKLDAG